MPCPLCRVEFVSATEVLHHIEDGDCPKFPKSKQISIKDGLAKPTQAQEAVKYEATAVQGSTTA